MENIWPKWLEDQRLYEYMLYDLRPSVLPPDCWCQSCHHVCDHPDYPEKEWKKFDNDLLVTGDFIFHPECPKCSGPMQVEPFEIFPDCRPFGLVNLHEGIMHKGEYLLHIFGDYHDGLPIEPDNCGITVQLHKVGTYEVPVGWYCISCSEPFTSVDWPEGCPMCEDEIGLVAFHPPPTDSEYPYECFGCGGFWFGDKREEPKECPICLTKSWNRPSPEIEMESTEYYATITSPLKLFEFCNWHFSEESEIRSPDQKYPYMMLGREVRYSMPPDCWCAECDYIGPHPDFSEETRRELEESMPFMDPDPECPKCGSDEMYVEPYDASPVYDPTEGGLHSGIRKSLEYSLRIPWLEYKYKKGQTIHCELTVRLIKEGTYDMSVGWLCDVCQQPFSSPDWPETCPQCGETKQLVAFHPPPTDSQNPYECLGCGELWFGDRWERPTTCPGCRTQYWNIMPPRGEGHGPRYYTMPSSPLTVLEFTYWSRFGDLS